MKNILEQMKLNYEPLKNDIVDTVALIRAVYKLRRHSLFGYVNLIFVDVFPRITKESVEKEIVLLKANIKKNEESIK